MRMTSTFRTFHMPENFYFDGMKSIEFESFQPSRQPVVIPRKKKEKEWEDKRPVYID